MLFYVLKLLPLLPPPVHKLHGLHSQSRGDHIISIMSPPTDDHESIHLPNNKHKIVLRGNTQLENQSLFLLIQNILI